LWTRLALLPRKAAEGASPHASQRKVNETGMPPEFGASLFSTVWKTMRRFFHAMEKVIHAMEKSFHTVEKVFHAVEVPEKQQENAP
jgi:hypothetical protein